MPTKLQRRSLALAQRCAGLRHEAALPQPLATLRGAHRGCRALLRCTTERHAQSLAGVGLDRVATAE